MLKVHIVQSLWSGKNVGPRVARDRAGIRMSGFPLKKCLVFKIFRRYGLKGRARADLLVFISEVDVMKPKRII